MDNGRGIFEQCITYIFFPEMIHSISNNEIILGNDVKQFSETIIIFIGNDILIDGNDNLRVVITLTSFIRDVAEA